MPDDAVELQASLGNLSYSCSAAAHCGLLTAAAVPAAASDVDERVSDIVLRLASQAKNNAWGATITTSREETGLRVRTKNNADSTVV